MNIIGIAACTSGIAHTYIAKEKLTKAGIALGHNIHIETQGTIGIEDEISAEQLKNADVVIIAADIKISEKDRFKGKKIVEIPTDLAIKAPKQIITKIDNEINN
ncbi:PTS fructose transporter subunit IIB [Listeria seeligeri]|uniref:PTS fructose transporter subunit IIB n=1 Tax=Listeria seeligeri TaxID=1640 RepID=UPI0016287F05|nr:PTS fructose transporter subunit IIB [Listeria seeligeri]MBC1442379.1 PTS fructose transporter subunit IIB [Listeria seeligeri]MBC1540340.1 PTS fructose transporter subunit IIB [Listeria seeligeri]MBC1582074.1 PTS fructose transporter subunit IIB [Listeria seeligeri]MBC1772115.1 PTS fructose transporter subunit IIB [Listeria seeligeri]MBC1866652.1 PTS fructose transporter subunit IIB [Listeria seeligeri]